MITLNDKVGLQGEQQWSTASKAQYDLSKIPLDRHLLGTMLTTMHHRKQIKS